MEKEINKNIFKEEKALKFNLLFDIVTIIPVVTIAILSNSIILFTDVFDYVKSILTTFFSWKITKKISQGKTILYDYGTGKLEVLVSLIVSVVMITGLLMMTIYTVHRIFDLEMLDEDYTLIGILIHIIGLFINCWFWRRHYRLAKVENSPLMNAQWRGNRADAFGNISVLTALILVLAFYDEDWSIYIDPICAIIFLTFPIISFVRLSVRDVNDLLDKTLDEEMQFKVLKILADYFDAYDAFFEVKSRHSGKLIFIDIVLGFYPDKTLSEALETTEMIKKDLESLIFGSQVNIIIKKLSYDELPKSLQHLFIMQPLTAKTMPATMKIIKEYFEINDDELPYEELEESVYPGRHTGEIAKIGISDPVYWVMLLKGEVVGVTGYYYKPEDRTEAVWGGWTAVDIKLLTSMSRIKRELLKKLIIEASMTGRKYFRLYTSTAPAERQANILYDRHKLNVYKTEPSPEGKYQLLYRQAEISDLLAYFNK